jgi:hypothetical protein
LTVAIGGCWDASLPFVEVRPLPARAEIHVPRPIDPGQGGTSRDLMQHYLADHPGRVDADRRRGYGQPRTVIPQGDGIEREAWGWDIPAETWILPFKSQRIIVTLVTTAARDRPDDLPLLIHPDARWGRPDPRLVGARPIFADDNGAEFLAAFQAALARIPEGTKYQNASQIVGGPARHLTTGSEPMWSYYEVDNDRILFRMRTRDGRPWVEYVGLYEDGPPAEPPNYDDLGPPPAMVAPTRRPDGSASPVFNPQVPPAGAIPPRGEMGTRRDVAGTRSVPSAPRSPR